MAQINDWLTIGNWKALGTAKALGRLGNDWQGVDSVATFQIGDTSVGIQEY